MAKVQCGGPQEQSMTATAAAAVATQRLLPLLPVFSHTRVHLIWRQNLLRILRSVLCFSAWFRKF
jgi:hypothetical protein